MCLVFVGVSLASERASDIVTVVILAINRKNIVIAILLNLDSSGGNGRCKRHIKLTTYAYQTKRGVSYHGEGITPDVFVEKSEAEDEQLKTAVGLLSAADQ